MTVQLLGTALSHLSPSLFVTQQSQPRTGALFFPDKTPNSLFSSVAGSWAIKDIQKNLELLTEGLGAGDLLPSGVLVSHSLMRLETPTFKPAVSCKGQASNVKGKKKNYLEIQSNLKILFSIISYSTNQLLIIIRTILRKMNLELDIESVWYLVFFPLHFPSPANPKVSDELRALYLEASGQGIVYNLSIQSHTIVYEPQEHTLSDLAFVVIAKKSKNYTFFTAFVINYVIPKRKKKGEKRRGGGGGWRGSNLQNEKTATLAHLVWCARSSGGWEHIAFLPHALDVADTFGRNRKVRGCWLCRFCSFCSLKYVNYF